MGIPGFWGGTKQVNIASGERFFLSVARLYWYVHLNMHLGNWASPGYGGNTLKASSKNEKQNKKYPSSQGKFPDGDNSITEDGHILPLSPCETKVWIGEVKRIF